MTSSIFSDHSNLPVLTQIAQENRTRPTTTRFGLIQQFWATPQRPATSPLTEVLEIALTTEQLVNWVEFDVSRYPCSVTVEYIDPASGLWLPMVDTTGATIARYIQKSVPARIPPSTAITGAKHPQHSFMGHWDKLSVETMPTRMQRLRIKLVRLNTASVPVDALGKRVDYSLAVRNLSLGYQVLSLDDVPRTLPDPNGNAHFEQFATADDVVASEVGFALRQLDAEIVGGLNEDDSIWKSELQPDPNAVVNLYLDVRTPTGEPQVVDRIFIDPINNGPHVTVYYAESAPPGVFLSPADPMPMSYPDTTAGTSVDGSGVHFANAVSSRVETGAFNADTSSFALSKSNIDASSIVVTSVDIDGNTTTYALTTDYTVDQTDGVTTITRPAGSTIADNLSVSVSYSFQEFDSIIFDNQFIGWNPINPWWLGMVVVPQEDAGSITNPLPFFTTDIFTLSWTATGLQLLTTDGDMISLDVAWQSGLQMGIVLSYDGHGYTLSYSSAIADDSYSVPVTVPVAEDSITTIAIGSDLDRISFAKTDVLRLVLKEETLTDSGAGFLADPIPYTVVEEFANSESDSARKNALWRFYPEATLTSAAYPWRMFAGRPNKYESMIWTPIPRDYTCQRGWMELPPTQAKYLKLEFTHLVAEYADIYQPVNQTVRHFPSSVLNEYRARTSVSATSQLIGDEQQEMLAGFTSYPDTPTVVSTGGNDTGYTNTEVYVADDATTAARLRALGAQWNYAEWQTAQSAPRFTKTQRHVYREEVITRTAKIGYAVGLRSIAIARNNYAAGYDVPQYHEPFFDDSGMVSSTWTYDAANQALTSGSSNVVALSQTMRSNRSMRGLQFAALQSPPQQLLSDPDFDDASHADWTATGDAQLGDTISSPSFGHLLAVSRIGGSGKWLDVEDNYPTWGAFTTAGVKWGDLASPNGNASTGADGVSSTSLAQPAGGYIYGAARVIADQDLTAPLWLQIYDTVTNKVLAESEHTVKKGKIAEWYTSYRIGTGTVNLGNITWGDLSGKTSHLQAYADDFARSDSATLGYLKSGQPWAGDPTVGSSSLHLVSGKATVTAAYPAQASMIDVGSPWGTLTIGLGTLIATDVLPIIKLGGFWVMNDGRIIDSNDDRTALTLTLASNDSLEFTFKPTSLLTSAENPSNIDPTVQGWAFTVTQNGTYIGTVASTRGIAGQRVLTGDTGQEFTSFEWDPRVDLPTPPAVRVREFPTAYESVSVTDPASGDTVITDHTGQQWMLSGDYTLVYSTPDGGDVNGIQASTGSSASATLDVNTVEGAMSGVANSSASTTDVSTWNMLLLDDTGTTQLYVRGNGDLVQSTIGLADSTLATNVFALGTPGSGMNSNYTVLIVATNKLSSAFKTAHSITATDAASQTLVFMVNEAVTATYTADNLVTTTRRGLLATDGATVSGFSWTPWLGSVSATTGSTRTWGQVDGNSTLTWGEVRASQNPSIETNPIAVRCVQKIYTNDTWLMDSMPIFFDPIVWEFSNNEGKDWIPASEIRNNPNAAILFPPRADTGVANRLVYRVSAYAPGVWVSNLVIRPWYVGFMRDVPVKPPQPHGPNLNPQDHYAPIEQDPHWMVWHEPIPREWWFAFRTILPSGAPPNKSLVPMVSERISINV